MEVVINEAQERYVLKQPMGYSCLGFDVVLREIRLMATRIKPLGWLNAHVQTLQRGSMEAYEVYRQALDHLRQSRIQTETWFDEETPAALKNVLEACRRDGTRVRLWYGDRQSGRSWMNENDVYGTIGRSGGTIRIPLICPPRSSSGSGLLDGSIVRIDDVIARKTLWAHRKFHLPETVLQAISPPMETDGQRYVVEALVEGKTHARFGSWDEAGHWLAMQSGRCLDNPEKDD